jgi:sec-independent protein translocase protein TatC
MKFSGMFKFREGDNGEAVKPFLDHLEDLRWVIIKMAVSLGVAMLLAFCFRTVLVHIMQAPLKAIDPRLVQSLVSLGVADSMTISFQLAFYAGIVVAFPFLIYFAGQFVLPALTPGEKKAMLPAVGVGFGLFLTGVVLGYYFVLPATLRFFFHDAQSLDWRPTWTVREYFSFVTQLCVGFGAAFELPVIVLVLVRFGVLSVALLRRTRAYAFLLIFIAAAFLAPTPDAVSMAMMGTPMYLLYELCIFVAWLMERKRKKEAAALAEKQA